MTQIEFDRAVQRFDGGEPMRAQLYEKALKLIDNGFRTEAHLLILATWNFARFRYVTKTFDLKQYDVTVDSLSKSLCALEGCDLMECDLPEHQTRITQAFEQLAGIEGIRFTGAAKILHLMHPNFFVMWIGLLAANIQSENISSLRLLSRAFGPIENSNVVAMAIMTFSNFARRNFEDLLVQTPGSRWRNALTSSTLLRSLFLSLTL